MNNYNDIKRLFNYKKNYDTVEDRMKFINSIINKSNIYSMLIYDNSEYNNNTKKNINHKGHDNNLECYDCRCILGKITTRLENVISNIGGTLNYINSGSTGHTFKGTVLNSNGEKQFEYAIKVVAYPNKTNYGDVYDIRRPENAELNMIRLLSYFVTNKKTPHITLPIGTFNTRLSDFIKITKNKYNDKLKFVKFVEKYKLGQFDDRVSILISEWATGGDLLAYIRNNYTNMNLMTWKVLFFQIISTLAVIHDKYPSFRHNDMKANNILLQLISKSLKKNNSVKYTINGKSYILPNIGLIIKLWDFDFACIPGIVDNNKASANWTKHINITPQQNRYYDIHYFFSTLIHKSFFPDFNSDYVPNEVKEFIFRILPKKYRVRKIKGKKNPNLSDKGRILVNDEYTIPAKIIETDHFFDEFHIENVEKITSALSNTNKKKKSNLSNNKYINNNKITYNTETNNKIITNVDPKKIVYTDDSSEELYSESGEESENEDSDKEDNKLFKTPTEEEFKLDDIDSSENNTFMVDSSDHVSNSKNIDLSK